MSRYHLVSAFVSLTCVELLCAHSGGLDSRGGHYDKKRGSYHFHGGGPSPSSLPDLPRKTTGSDIPSLADSLLETKTRARSEPKTSARTDAYLGVKEIDSRADEKDRFRPKFVSGWSDKTTDEKAERVAAAKLAMAKKYIDMSNLLAAHKILKEIVTDFSSTAVFNEAKELLEIVSNKIK